VLQRVLITTKTISPKKKRKNQQSQRKRKIQMIPFQAQAVTQVVKISKKESEHVQLAGLSKDVAEFKSKQSY